MSLEFWFWLVCFLWLIGGIAPVFKAGEKSWSGIGASLLPLIAIALLGWQVFGAPIHR